MKQWVIPPKKSAPFVAAMEQVLDLYCEPYDPARPVVCLDERPCLLRQEARPPLPMRPGQDACRDYEYVRSSTCCVLMAFYERYPPEEARRLAERIEFVYTPVHGSWLNAVEIEFSVMVRQSLGRRIGTLQELARAVEAWAEARNANGTTVQWQFTTADARIKLRRLYPSVSA